MATGSGGSKSKSTSRGGTAKRSTSASKRSSTTSERKTAQGTTGRTQPSTDRSDKSVQAFRDALDRSRNALESNVTLSRERIQEVVDDAVQRGRMTRGDANELVTNLVNRGRKATDDLIHDLEKLLEQARGEVESRAASTRRQATRAAERVSRAARDAGERPLAEVDKLRRRAGVPGSPITAYDQLTAAQVKSRLGDLSPAQLRQVRAQEQRGKARKGILDAIQRRLK